MLSYWTQLQRLRLVNSKKYRNMRRGAAARELYRDEGLCVVNDEYQGTPTKRWRGQIHAKRKDLPKGICSWYKGADKLWRLGQTHSADLVATDTHIVRFIDP